MRTRPAGCRRRPGRTPARAGPRPAPARPASRRACAAATSPRWSRWPAGNTRELQRRSLAASAWVQVLGRPGRDEGLAGTGNGDGAQRAGAAGDDLAAAAAAGAGAGTGRLTAFEGPLHLVAERGQVPSRGL